MNRAEAIKMCEDYEVNFSEHPHIVVTSNNNIYLNGKVDPADKGERIELNIEDVDVVTIPDSQGSDEESETTETNKPKKKK